MWFRSGGDASPTEQEPESLFAAVARREKEEKVSFRIGAFIDNDLHGVWPSSDRANLSVVTTCRDEMHVLGNRDAGLTS